MQIIKRNRKYNFTFQVEKNGKVVDRCQTHSKCRFYDRIRMINWQNDPLKVYLRVTYGKAKSCFGKMEKYYNDGFYDNKKDFLYALEAFSKEKI
jgi:hypothetical protein